MEKEIEKWKKIPEWNYWVSNFGRLRSRKKVITPQYNSKTGIAQCMAYNKGKQKLFNMSTLTGRIWLPPAPHEGMVVRHISDNKRDDRVSNLTWGWPGKQKNQECGIAVGGEKIRRRQKYKFRYFIQQRTTKGLVIGTYSGWDELETMGYKRSSIIRCSNGKYPKGIYKGFVWVVQKIKVKNEED